MIILAVGCHLFLFPVGHQAWFKKHEEVSVHGFVLNVKLIFVSQNED